MEENESNVQEDTLEIKEEPENQEVSPEVDPQTKDLENLEKSDPVVESKPSTVPSGVRVKKVLLLFVIIIIVTVAVVAWLLLYPSKKISKSYNAEISLVSGQVEKSEVSGTWTELKNGDGVSQGDLVRVNGEGKTVISLDDGSAIRLDSDSRVKLTSLDPKNIVIDNEAGEVYSRVVKADRPFVVKIDDESYKAMGTAYKTVNDTDEKGVYVYESKVKVVSEDKEIKEGEKYLTQNDSDDSLIRKILEIASDEISADNFIQWNKAQDLKSDEFKKYLGVLEAETTTDESETTQTENTDSENNQNQTTTPAVEASITLSGSASGDAVRLTWTASGIDTSKGFKLVKSTSPNPVYPGNSYVYISNGNSYSWRLTDGVVYNFRVCQYIGNGCGVYSNNIQVTAPYVADGTVNSITLSSGDGINVNWTVDGYSDNGFKLVWSKTSGPTYPTRKTDRYHYYSSANTTTGTIEDFDGNGGTYYVRVCEYLGGACGVYSNEIIVELTETR